MTARAPARRPQLGRPPVLLLVPAALAAALVVVPLLALLLRTPWTDLADQLARSEVLQALWLTIATSLLTVLLCVLLGTPLAWVLARTRFPGIELLRAVITLPLVLPPVVAGVALVAALGRDGVLGRPLYEGLGWTIPYTTTAVVLAHTFVALPFFVISVDGALRSRGQEYDVVAASLGASRWTTFRRVTVPTALPALAAGAALAWARSLGEFGATITFAGNYPGTTQTMPSLIYQTLQDDPGLARTLSLLLVIPSVAILVLLRHRWLSPLTRAGAGR